MSQTTEAYWGEQVKKALAWRKKVSHESSWSTLEQIYAQKFERATDPHFNLLYIMGSTLVPTLVFQRPGIVNTARRPEFNNWATIFDGIDNWLVDEMELASGLSEGVEKAYLNNIVGVELNYDFPPEGSTMGSEMQFEPVEGTIDRTRKYNQPWIDFIEARKLIFAPGTKNMRNCRWYGKYVRVPLETFKAKYKKLKNVEATHVVEETKENTESPKDWDSRKYIDLWVIRNAEKGEWLWINSAGKIVMPPEKDPLQIDGLPLQLITFNTHPNNIWGTPDAQYILTQQMEGDELRYDGRLQRKIALVKCFYDDNLLKEEDIAKFITSKALGCIPVTVPTDKKLSDIIQLVQPHVQMELTAYAKELMNDAQLLLGQGPNQIGTFAPGRRTKFEAQVVEERSFLRIGERRNKLADVVGNTMGQINQLLVKNWTAPVVVRVVGIDAAVYWVKALPSEFKDLRAQLVTKVNVESLAPTSRERRKEEMIQVMDVISKLASAMPNVNIVPIVQKFLSQFDWVDVTQSLPAAQQTSPMSMNEFQGQQQQMANNPALPQMMQNNMGGIAGLVNKLPPNKQQGS